MSRSTWACELKWIFRKLAVMISRHAPRERVSWNPLYTQCKYYSCVTLHVSVWVEITRSSSFTIELWSHAPRERVSWNFGLFLSFTVSIVTLHVSVWVEIQGCSTMNLFHYVTLHVSVWVEMFLPITTAITRHVTLHVSVWVEIVHWTLTALRSLSRSTWACELKYTYLPQVPKR